MAVITTIFTPDRATLAGYRRCVELLGDRLLPQPLQAQRSTKVSEHRGYLLAIHGRQDHVRRRGFSCVSGLLDTDGAERWWTVGEDAPDGSFCLFRSGQRETEVISDFTGSRTIWYARLPCGGLATSTAFEMVVGLLGDFQPDEKSLGWFLSSGTCGPRRSWDRRIKPLGANTRLYARRGGDAVEYREYELERPVPVAGRVDEALLSSSISEAFASLEMGTKPWLVALSGGYDSRAILYGLRNVPNLRCVTWADDGEPTRPGSDADVARDLARAAGREHDILRICRPGNADMLDQAARRFVRYADGRIDNLLAYIDGMSIWDEMCTREAGGLMRGDELFGSSHASSESRILHNMRLASFDEYGRDDMQRRLAAAFTHRIPTGLQQRPGETTAAWRLRLRTDFEIPTVYAALNAIRSRFLENVCPLLMRRPVSVAAAISASGSDDKSLYKRVVAGNYADVPFADSRSILGRAEFMGLPQAQALIQDYLNSDHASAVLGRQSVAAISHAIAHAPAPRPGGGDRRMTSRGGPWVPRWLRRARQSFMSAPRLNVRLLALRSYLCSIIHEEFSESAATGRRACSRVERVSA